MSHLKIIHLVLCLFLIGCGESVKDVSKEKFRIQAEVVENFKKTRSTFKKIKIYFKLNHIKDIEFHNDGLVSITCQTGSNNNNDEWVTLRRKIVVSNEIGNLLELDGLKTNDLLQLKTELCSINVNKLTILDTYDVDKSKLARAIDLRYNIKTNALHFYYRIFREPIHSVPASFYEQLARNNSTGGILSDTTIWYYK